MNTMKLKNQNGTYDSATPPDLRVMHEQGAGPKEKRSESKGKGICVDADKCTGCRTCQVRCSVMKQGQFNPFKSCLTITRDHGLRTTDIILSDECTNCGSCVSVCNYGALFWKDGEIN